MGVRLVAEGAARSITRARVVVGGILREVRVIRVQAQGQLRLAYTRASPMTAAASPDYVVGFDRNGRGIAMTNSTTAIPAGGVGPYRYSWAVSDTEVGSLQIASPSNATTSFTAYVGARQMGTANITCAVTDSLGETALASVIAYFEGRSSGEIEQ